LLVCQEIFIIIDLIGWTLQGTFIGNSLHEDS